MPTENEFRKMFEDVNLDSSDTYTEDAIETCKRLGFTFDPEPVTPEQTEVADATADALIATADAVEALTQRLTAEEDRVGRLENQVESYKGIIEDLGSQLAKLRAYFREMP